MSAARRLRRGMPAALALLLAACAGNQNREAAWHAAQPAGVHSYYRVGAPYEVNGVWYYPAVDYHYDRTGIASWYGPGYNGRLTANGEVFDMNALSAAHPTLPLPSIVRVTNLENGRSLDLRVNDRGPFVDGRIIDVSRRAAQLLGFESEGIAPVRVKILKRQSIEVAELAKEGIVPGTALYAQAAPSLSSAPPVRIASAASPPPLATAAPAPPPALASPVATVAFAPPPAASPPPRLEPATFTPPPIQQNVRLVSYRPPARRAVSPVAYRPPIRQTAAPRPAGRIFVQAGAFSVPGNAWRVRARIAALAHVEVSAVAIGGVTLYRVRLGPFASAAAANRVLARVIDSGYPGARMVFN
jgi:rare lipoprotein A